jgi:hypothetical protein
MALNTNTAIVKITGNKATLKFYNSGTINVVGNSTANSDLSLSNGSVDPVVGASITGLWWSVLSNSTIAGTVNIQRQANSTVNTMVASLSGSGSLSKETGWKGDALLPASNVVVTFAGPGSGSNVSQVWVEFTKLY